MNRIARKVTVTVAAVAAAGGLLLGTTGCKKVCHTGWAQGHSQPPCVWVK